MTFPLVMLTIHHGASTIFFLLCITRLISIPFHQTIKKNQVFLPWWLYVSFLIYPFVVITHGLIDHHLNSHSFEIALRFLLIPLLLFYRPYIKNSWHDLLYLAFALGAIASLISAIHHNHFNFNLRALTYFTGPTNFGDLIVPLGILSIGATYYTHKKIIQWIGLFGIISSILGAYLSQTRGSWVAILCASLILFCKSHRIKLFQKILGFIVVSVGFVGLYLHNPIIHQRINDAFIELKEPSIKHPGSSLGLRKELWRSAILIIKENPMQGIGVSQYSKTLQSQVKESKVLPSLSAGFAHPHNEVLYAWAELGVLGAIGVLAFYFGPVLFFYSFIKHKKEGVRRAAKLGLMIVLSYVIFGLVDVMITTWVMESSIYVLSVLVPIYIIMSSLKKSKQ